jgi:hypothetical protein
MINEFIPGQEFFSMMKGEGGKTWPAGKLRKGACNATSIFLVFGFRGRKHLNGLQAVLRGLSYHALGWGTIVAPRGL